MLGKVTSDWADGISPSLRHLIAAGAGDNEIARFVRAVSAGDKEGASAILRNAKMMAKPRDSLSVDSILECVRIAAFKPVVNSLDATQLQHYVRHLLHISGVVVQELKDEPFWSADAAIDAVANVVRQTCLDLLRTDPGDPRTGHQSACFQVSREAGVVADKDAVTLISTQEFAIRLGWSAGRVNRALASRSIFAMETDGVRQIPAFLADPRFNGSQIRAVCGILGELPGGSKLQFFASPKASLGGSTPLDLLAEGKFSVVKAAARGFIER